MQQRELLRRIRRAARAAGVGFTFVRHGGAHDLYDYAGQRVTIPRHSEINEKLARAILRELGIDR